MLGIRMFRYSLVRDSAPLAKYEQESLLASLAAFGLSFYSRLWYVCKISPPVKDDATITGKN